MSADKGNLRLAVVGLVGAVIGGLLSMAGVVYAEHVRDQRAAEKEGRAAKAAGLVVVDEFRGAALYFERMLQHDRVEPVPPGARIVISDADRRLILRSDLLPDDAYGRASEAASNGNLLIDAMRARERRTGKPYAKAYRVHRELFAATARELSAGREALRPLTGESPAITPTPPLRVPQPGLEP